MTTGPPGPGSPLLPQLSALAAEFSESAQTMSLVAFTAVATLSLLLCVMTGPDRDDLGEFYTGSRGLSPARGGLAIAGDYISAATVLSTVGIIALTGYDGLVLALSTGLSLVLLMFLLAEPLRNAGRFTMGDALARRFPGRAVRMAACGATLAALLPMMVVQLAGAGDLLAFVFDFRSPDLKTGCIVGTGILMISYAAIGGMPGTALIQLVKMVMLLGSGAAVAALTMSRFGWNPAELLAAAQRGSGTGDAYLRSGLQFAESRNPRLDMITSQLTVVLGGACLPHVTMRMYAARSATAIRRSMSWAVSAVVAFTLLIAVLGFGASALVGRHTIADSDPRGSTALLLGTEKVLGPDVTTAETLVFTAMATTVFLTVLASVAGMILACANSLAHDVAAQRRRKLPARTEMRLARISALAVGVPAIALAALAQHRSLQPLIVLSFSLGASVLAPALLYGLFWRRFTRAGLLCTLVGGTVGSVALMTGTNLVSGSPGSAFPGIDINWFPFTTTGIASVPLGFLLGWLGTALSPARRRAGQRRRYEAVEGLILAGAERPGAARTEPGASGAEPGTSGTEGTPPSVP